MGQGRAQLGWAVDTHLDPSEVACVHCMRLRQAYASPALICKVLLQQCILTIRRVPRRYHKTSLLHAGEQVDMFPPGRLVFLRPFKGAKAKQTVWDAVWVDAPGGWVPPRGEPVAMQTPRGLTARQCTLRGELPTFGDICLCA